MPAGVDHGRGRDAREPPSVPCARGDARCRARWYCERPGALGANDFKLLFRLIRAVDKQSALNLRHTRSSFPLQAPAQP